jgi:hypothetical protein
MKNEVSFGSKPVKLGRSKCLPVFLRHCEYAGGKSKFCRTLQLWWQKAYEFNACLGDGFTR